MTSLKKIISIVLLLVCLISLLSCNQSESTPAISNEPETTERKPTGEIFFDFQSNSDGTCAARILYADTDDQTELSVTFPAVSPNGEKIVTLSESAVTRYGNVPVIFFSEDFQIVSEKLKQVVDADNEHSFSAKVCLAYYLYRDINHENITESDRDYLLEKYPIIQQSALYVFDPTSSYRDYERVSHCLFTTIGFNMEDCKKIDEKTGYTSTIGRRGNIVSAVVPDGVTTLDGTFCGWDTLKTVSLPASITEIREYSFSYCSELKEIQFTGTKDQWEAIQKNSNWAAFADDGAFTIVCTDGRITFRR